LPWLKSAKKVKEVGVGVPNPRVVAIIAVAVKQCQNPIRSNHQSSRIEPLSRD
jgi:hypothetical protein